MKVEFSFTHLSNCPKSWYFPAIPSSIFPLRPNLRAQTIALYLCSSLTIVPHTVRLLWAEPSNLKFHVFSCCSLSPSFLLETKICFGSWFQRLQSLLVGEPWGTAQFVSWWSRKQRKRKSNTMKYKIFHVL